MTIHFKQALLGSLIGTVATILALAIFGTITRPHSDLEGAPGYHAMMMGTVSIIALPIGAILGAMTGIIHCQERLRRGVVSMLGIACLAVSVVVLLLSVGLMFFQPPSIGIPIIVFVITIPLGIAGIRGGWTMFATHRLNKLEDEELREAEQGKG